MSLTNWQDPGTREIRSTDISGLQEIVSKLERSVGMETVSETDIPLTEVYISENDRWRIFQAPEGKRNWVSEPAPVIKRDGVPIDIGFVIDYGAGAIILATNDTEEHTYTADATYIKSLQTSLNEELATHLADLVTDGDGVHGLKIEQGTWTPTLYGGTTSGSPVYSIRLGRYMRIGNLVYLSGRIDITSKGGLAGAIRISGLPFAGNSNISQNINISECHNLTFNGIPLLEILPNANYISLILVKTGTAATNITDADITDSFAIRFAGIYQIN